MKPLLALLLIMFSLPGCSHSETVITPEQAAAHLGETTTVEGIVSTVTKSKKGNIFLNFGGKYPNQIFTAYAPSIAGLDYGDLKSLEGKMVRVIGKIGSYKGKPEIVVNKRSQIEP